MTTAFPLIHLAAPRSPGLLRPPTRPQAAMPCAAAALALAMSTACGGDPAGARRGQPPVPVTTDRVVRKTVPLEVRAIGHIEPIATVAVKARIGGELTKVHFREGQYVRAGDTLLTIDPRQYAAALRQAEAQLARDQAIAKKAEADVARYVDLVAKDFVTREQYDSIVANAASQRATVQADQASVDNARLQVAYCTIQSPISGRTGNLVAKVGNLIKANDDSGLVTVNQMKPIYASFTVPAQLLPDLTSRKGQKLRVAASLPGEAKPEWGELSFVDNGVDPATSTVLLKATFANDGERLWAGQFVDVILTLGEEANRLIVPIMAVQSGQQGDYVFVVKADQSVDLRTIKVGRRDDKEAVIDSGIEEGDVVVTDGQLRLVPGAKVQVKDAAAPEGEKR